LHSALPIKSAQLRTKSSYGCPSACRQSLLFIPEGLFFYGINPVNKHMYYYHQSEGSKKMTDKAFDSVARLIHSYEKALMVLPHQVKRQAFDIRLKAGQPVTIWGKEGVFYLKEGGAVSRNLLPENLFTSKQHLKDIFMDICSHSVFSHENEIRKGYIQVGEHYRVGICGTAVLDGESIKTLKDISTLVFRIPRERPGSADVLFQRKVDFRNGLLIAGEPSSGKTTLLRDIAAQLTYGIHVPAMRIAILDERAEIGSGFTLGPGADILKGYPKREGMSIALRTLSPELILCDELSEDELESVTAAAGAGVPVIASVHSSYEDLMKKPGTRALVESRMFETIAFLRGRSAPGAVDRIVNAGECIENYRNALDYAQHGHDRDPQYKKAEKTREYVA